MYVLFVRNTCITDRNYDPTLIPFPQWFFSQGASAPQPRIDAPINSIGFYYGKLHGLFCPKPKSAEFFL